MRIGGKRPKGKGIKRKKKKEQTEHELLRD